jgi:hypothetical protein
MISRRVPNRPAVGPGSRPLILRRAAEGRNGSVTSRGVGLGNFRGLAANNSLATIARGGGGRFGFAPRAGRSRLIHDNVMNMI